MTMTATQSRLACDHAFTVVGFLPSGEGYADTVLARRPEEAQLRVIAGMRYADDGGDLAVSCVLDAITGAVVDDQPDESATIMREYDALDAVATHLRFGLPALDAATVGSDDHKLNACLEMVELVLQDAPHALDAIAAGAEGYADEDLVLHFIDSMGEEHVFSPADAILALSRRMQQQGWSPAAVQLEELATRARCTVSLAILDAICDI